MEAIEKLFRQTWRYLVSKISFMDLMAFVGFALSIAALLKSQKSIDDSVIWIFGLYILVLAILLAAREYSYSRKARYAEAMRALHRCSHEIRDANWGIEENNHELCMLSVKSALNSLATAFSIITGTSCRACIKIIYHDSTKTPVEFYTSTFCRNQKVASSANKDSAAPIEENTDFTILYRQSDGENYFISNDLTKRKSYHNSNWPSRHDDRAKFIKERKYQYISTAVWPIRAREGDNNPEVIGFLCVDSLARGVFRRRYDIDTGAIIADMLYYMLYEYRNAFADKLNKGN